MNWSLNQLADETEDEDANEEYVEETNQDAIMIAAAKLVASGAVHKVIMLYLFKTAVLISYGKSKYGNSAVIVSCLHLWCIKVANYQHGYW